MTKIYHLATCKTCQKVLVQLPTDRKDVVLREIKTTPITKEELEAMHQRTGSYEALFSRRAMKYRSMGLQDKTLSEEDYKQLILDEYTFLKRPVILTENDIFIGSAKKTVEAAQQALSQ